MGREFLKHNIPGYPPKAGKAHGRFTRHRRGKSLHMYYVYVLKSLKDGRRYVGMTNNLERRIGEHNRGKSSTPSTKSRGPFILVYQEGYPTRNDARSREIFFKSGKGREFLKHNIPG